MPTVATVAGCAIRFYHQDHEPHLHAVTPDGTEAQVGITDGVVLCGGLPAPQRRVVLDWAAARRGALALAWLRCRDRLDPGGSNDG